MSAASEPLSRSDLETLRGYAPFDQLDEAALDFLAARLVLRRYAAGSAIAVPGRAASQRLHIIMSGLVHNEPSRPFDLNEEAYPTLGSGECFPIVALLAESDVSNVYRALEPTECLELEAADFGELLRVSPQFQRHCSRRIAVLLQQARTLMHSHAVHLSAEQQSLASPLRSLIRRAPVTCSPQTPIHDALDRMRRERVGSIVITAADGAPLGIFTQQDLIDRVALTAIDLADPISRVMTPQPVTLPADASAYDAALMMAQHRTRHLPVVEEAKIIGLVSERDLFSAQRISLRQLPETIAAARDIAALERAALDIRQLTRDMLAHGLAAEQLTQFIAALNDRLSQRVIGLELVRHTLPGIHVCWLALGSEGRLEQTLATDQDNGIIFSHPEAMTPDAVRERLLPFAAAVNQALDRCGFPLCKGNIMAGNPQWCLSLAEWQAQFTAWIRVPEPQALLNSTIFFDFRAVFGEASLADRLRHWLLAYTQATPLFLYQMAQGALHTRPPLGIVRDFVVDGSKEFPHTIDLKLYGLRPFVEVARIYALRFGIAHTNTAQRLRLAAPKLGIASEEVRAAVDAFYFIQLLRLRHQQSAGGAQTGPNRIDPDELNELDRRILKESFRQARKLQQRLALDYPQ